MVPAMRRRALVVVLLCVMGVLTPLAHASPADPTWIGGFYDDADYDDVVLSITGGVTAVEAVAATPVGPVAVRLGLVDPGRPRTVPAHPLASPSPRAPPHPLA
jgi:hypothetical protein